MGQRPRLLSSTKENRHAGKIFNAFFTTKARGSGLGLPAAKRLIEAHGGTLTVECPPAGGTIVTVHLPGESAAAMMSPDSAFSSSRLDRFL
jgi:nitrogen-specific signal transduction histidine kinase